MKTTQLFSREAVYLTTPRNALPAWNERIHHRELICQKGQEILHRIGMKPDCQLVSADGVGIIRRHRNWLSVYWMRVAITLSMIFPNCVSLILPVEAAIFLRLRPVACLHHANVRR